MVTTFMLFRMRQLQGPTCVRVGANVNGESVDARKTTVAYIYVPAAMDTNSQSLLSFQERYQHLTDVWKGIFKGDMNTPSNYRKDFF
jgi:hypothetical protein